MLVISTWFCCILLQDLKKNTKILAADGATILEVKQVDVHQTTKLLDVETFGYLMGKGLAKVVRKDQISRASKSLDSFSRELTWDTS